LFLKLRSTHQRPRWSPTIRVHLAPNSSVVRLEFYFHRVHFDPRTLHDHGALAAALSAAGSLQRQISFAAPFWCGGRAGREVLCALALARPPFRSARRLLTPCAPDELLCGRQFCGGWTPRRALRGDSARYVAIRSMARSSVLSGFAVRQRRRLSARGRQRLLPLRAQPSERARQRRRGGVQRASGCFGHLGS